MLEPADGADHVCVGEALVKCRHALRKAAKRIEARLRREKLRLELRVFLLRTRKFVMMAVGNSRRRIG